MKKLILRLKFNCSKVQLVALAIVAATAVVITLTKGTVLSYALLLPMLIVALYAVCSGKSINEYYKYSPGKVHVINLRTHIRFRMKVKRIFKKNAPEPGIKDMIKSSINMIDQLPAGSYRCVTHEAVYKRLKKDAQKENPCVTNLIVHDPCLYEMHRYKLQRICGEHCKKDSTKYKMMAISFDIVR